MPEPEKAKRVVRFGVFEVDFHTTEVRKQGVRIRLSGQSFQVLEALLLRPGELVTREELTKKLWPSDTFGDFEHGLNAAVNRVREALGDSADNPRFVETLSRRGYRFVAPVENYAPEGKTTKTATSASDTVSDLPPVPKRHWISAVVLLLLLISIGAFLIIRLRIRQSQDGRPDAEQNLRATPLTTLPGSAVSPSFSPDGSQVAFAWDGGSGNATNSFNLYVKAVGWEKIDQLTHQPGDFIVPAWSPDGSTIAFARKGGDRRGIFSIPARGGAERKLADANLDCPCLTSLSWSPDGRQLLYYSVEGLRILTLENGEVRPVDTPGCEPPALAAFSPDGKWVAFTCGKNAAYYIDLLSLKDGSARELVKAGLGSLAWSNDSQRVISEGFTEDNITEVNINGGNTQNLAFAQDAYQPAVAPRGNRLAYVKGEFGRPEIWRRDTRTGLEIGVFAPASVDQRAPDISPDGKRITFESERSGFHEVWVANLDGSEAIQLSNFHTLTGTPRWSPDGQRIVFDSRATGKAALYLVDPATALPKQIPTGNVSASVPSWSTDGKWIYFTSASDPAQPGFLYRVPTEGGSPEQVTQTRGYNIKQSKDGRFLYFFAGSLINGEIHSLDLASGHERALPEMPRITFPTDWALGSKGIFFTGWGPKASIDFFDFALQRITRKIPLENRMSIWGGLALSSDETWLAYSQVTELKSDLMLVEGFQ